MFENFRNYVMIILVLSLAIPVNSFVGGNGTDGNPYQISTCTQLQNMSSDLNADYVLNSDVDCSGFVGFVPIAPCNDYCNRDNDDVPFNGNFNGNNYTISDLSIINKVLTTRGWGMFASTNYSIIKDVIFNNLIMDIRNTHSGGVIGYNNYGEISNIHVTNGWVNASITTGGIIGENNYGNINNVSFEGIVYGAIDTGGVIGQNSYGFINNSNAIADIYGSINAGIFAGKNYHAVISNSYSSGNSFGDLTSGGFVGQNYMGNITNSYSSGNVYFSNTGGGLVGKNYKAKVMNSYSKANVFGGSNAGGLVGDNYYSSVINAYSINSVNGSNNVGGLVGNSYGSIITNSFSNSDVTGNDNVGGLVGYKGNTDNTINSYSVGDVSGNTNVGGLVGYGYNAVVTNSYWLNTSNNPDVAFGYDDTGQTATAQINIDYFYNVINSPINLWNNSDWDFFNSTFQHIEFENYVESVPLVVSSGSSTSLPSFGFYSVILSFGLIIGILLF